MPRILFGPWEPDKPAFLAKGSREAINVYAMAGGYRPMRSPEPIDNAQLPDDCLGAVSLGSISGLTQIFAGTTDTLYRLTDAGFVALAAGYATTGGLRWRFVQFGGLLLATNGFDPIQKIDLATFATAPLGTGAGTDAGTPPHVQYMTVVRDFVLGGLVNGQPQTVAWSGINDAEWWSYGSRQSDYQELPVGGRITGLFGGEIGIILQANRVTRMTYVGDNVVFQFDEVSDNIGCSNQYSVVQWGGLGFFLSNAGFMMWNGSALKPIGQERVDRYFRAQQTPIQSAAIDPPNSLVIWSTESALYIYNWLLDQWTTSTITAPVVVSGQNRNDLTDTPTENRFYTFDQDRNLCALTGPNLSATVTATAFEIGGGRSARLRLARPIGDAEDGVTVTLATIERLGADAVPVSYTSVSRNGDMPVRQSGRYVTAGVTYAAGADWTFLQGIDLTLEAGARR